MNLGNTFSAQKKGESVSAQARPKKISDEKEEAVLSPWKRFPGFGPGQVRNQLRRQRITVSSKTVRQIMEANGYKLPRKKTGKTEAPARFEASRPLELVQMDILS